MFQRKKIICWNCKSEIIIERDYKIDLRKEICPKCGKILKMDKKEMSYDNRKSN